MLRDKIKQKKIITLEILLPLNTDIEKLGKTLEPVGKYIDAFNIPSNPLGRLRPDAMSCAYLLQEKSHIETIPHFVARHFTSLSFESHLLGAATLGIKNILCVTGDSPVGGRSAFELNSARLLEIARNLSRGITSARKAIQPIDLCLCTSFNPNVPNVQGEYIKSTAKYHGGAEIFFTQPIFQPDRFLNILREFRSRFKNARVVAGLSYLHTQKRAFRLMKFLGVPYEYIQNIESCDETTMLLDIARKLVDYVDGFYIIPILKYGKALSLVKHIRLMFDQGK